MRELTDRELYQALHYAKSLDENAGRALLEQFQTEQPALAQTLFGVFPALIAEQDQVLAHLFMDLCFDVICVFQHAFGRLPDQKTLGFDWLQNSAMLLDSELQAMLNPKMAPKLRQKLQARFSERMIDSDTQRGLVKFMNESITEFAAEQTLTGPALRTTQTMIFVVVQLLNSIYDHIEQTAR